MKYLAKFQATTNCLFIANFCEKSCEKLCQNKTIDIYLFNKFPTFSKYLENIIKISFHGYE